MREKDNKLLIICIILLSLAVGVIYALLKADLNVVGTGTIDAANWDIYFNNLNLVEKKGRVKILSSDLSVATVVVDIELSVPMDSALYTFDVVNDGDLDAKIAEIILPNLEHLSDNFITYQLTYEDGTAIQIGDTLNAGVTKTLKLFIKYAEISDPALLNQFGEFSEELSATILYVQA